MDQSNSKQSSPEKKPKKTSEVFEPLVAPENPMKDIGIVTPKESDKSFK